MRVIFIIIIIIEAMAASKESRELIISHSTKHVRAEKKQPQNHKTNKQRKTHSANSLRQLKDKKAK